MLIGGCHPETVPTYGNYKAGDGSLFCANSSRNWASTKTACGCAGSAPAKGLFADTVQEKVDALQPRAHRSGTMGHLNRPQRRERLEATLEIRNDAESTLRELFATLLEQTLHALMLPEQLPAEAGLPRRWSVTATGWSMHASRAVLRTVRRPPLRD